MKFKLFATLVACGAAAFGVACTTTTIDGLGGFGGDSSDDVTSTGSKTTSTGTKSTTATGTGTGTTGTTNPATTSTSTGGACDDGTPGDIGDATCQACVTCTQTGACMTEWQTYGSDPDYTNYSTCVQACASGDEACFTQCDNNYPAEAANYQAAAGCSVCQECVNNCNAAGNCTAG